jgi:hypothetical protein
VVNRKVVDLTTLCNFHECHMVFFSTVLHKMHLKFEGHSVSRNRRCWTLTKISTLFHSKLEMPSYMKVVSLDKLDNFHIGRF